jgi:predicted nucleic acid-binding protein
MSVVSDTSPLNYLVLIELQDLLPELFDQVLIPDVVHRELQAAGAPDPVKRFFASAPDWLDVRPSPGIDPQLRHLDAGERAVITLALSLGSDSVLLDERKGRKAARDRGLLVSGTLGVIRLAAGRGLVTLSDALDRLEKTTFRASQKLLDSVRDGGADNTH